MKCWEWGDIDEKVMINLLPFFFQPASHTAAKDSRGWQKGNLGLKQTHY